MPEKINDAFAKLKVSRQRKWQLRLQALGRCITCGCRCRGIRCPKHKAQHHVYNRERQRKRTGAVRRNLNAASYRGK